MVQSKFGKRLGLDAQKDILARYASGAAAKDIARDLHISPTSVYNALLKHGVETRVHAPLSDEEKARIIEDCRSGKTVREVGKIHRVGRRTIFAALQGSGVHTLKRSCSVNDAAFDVLTPESAYWLGFIFADGTVGREVNRTAHIGVNIAVKDRGHVEKFRAFLGSTHTIGTRPPGKDTFGGSTAEFKVRSARLADAVITRGMFEVKAERFPVPELEASRDFWRGAVDGDGSVGTMFTKGRPYPVFSLAGQHRLLESFRRFLVKNLSLALKISPTESGIYRIGTGAAPGLAVIRLLYENAVVALDRKNARAQTLLTSDVAPYFPPY